ncbi:MAG: cell division protein FtsL [Oscillospiraceae bacterium]|nr:cell division protein FtsL [Oscillospiraceae bacterium]
MNNRTEAYDLSLFEPRPAKVVKLKTNKKLQKAQKRKNVIQSIINTTATICVAALAVTVIGMLIVSRVRLTEMDDKINSMEKQLIVLQSEKTRLTDELARKTSTKSVEEYAYETLGMQKVDSTQIEYIESENTDKAVVANKENSGFLKAAGQAIIKFFTQLAYLFD